MCVCVCVCVCVCEVRGGRGVNDGLSAIHIYPAEFLPGETSGQLCTVMFLRKESCLRIQREVGWPILERETYLEIVFWSPNSLDQ